MIRHFRGVSFRSDPDAWRPVSHVDQGFDPDLLRRDIKLAFFLAWYKYNLIQLVIRILKENLRHVWIMAKNRGSRAAFSGLGSCWTHPQRPQALADWLSMAFHGFSIGTSFVLLE